MFKYTFENSNSDKNNNEKQVIKDHKISVQKSSGEELFKNTFENTNSNKSDSDEQVI